MHEGLVALLVAVRIVVPGWLWTGPSGDRSGSTPPPADWLTIAGRAIALGLVLNLLPALCVAQYGAWTRVVDWVLWCLVVLAGLVRSRGRFTRRYAAGAGYAIVWVALVTGVILARPPRSEWFAGGWDPGLYQNEAAAIARADGFVPRTDSVYARLTAEERPLFGYQVFPAVPVDRQRGAIGFYFFPLTPMCGAWMVRLGGLDLLSRMNQVLALVGLPVVAALAGLLGLAGWRRVAVVAAWLVSPLWWYHQAIPTSEMLHLVLLVGAMVFYLEAERNGRRYPVGAALLLMAGGINHFGFPPLAAMMLVVSAMAESVAQRPGRVGRLLTCMAALACGLAWDLMFSPATIQMLEVKDGVLPLVLLPFGIFLVMGYAFSRRGVHPRLVVSAVTLVRWGAMVVGVLLIGLSVGLSFSSIEPALLRITGRLPLVGEWVLRFSRFIPFHRSAWFVLLGVGTLFLVHDRSAGMSRVRVVATALAGVVALLFLNPGIAPIYPWAFRRYIVFLLPLMAVVAGAGLTLPVRMLRMPAWAGRLLGVLLMTALCLVGGKASRRAARVGDYVGLREVLSVLNGKIPPGAMVVADDPGTGTPLLLLYGRDVFEGSRLWKSGDPEYQARYVAVLRRLQAGRRILWLTSTDHGMNLYPALVGSVSPWMEPVTGVYRTVIHSPNADEFATREHARQFQLFVWDEPDMP